MSFKMSSAVVFSKDLPQSPRLDGQGKPHTLEEFRHAPRSLLEPLSMLPRQSYSSRVSHLFSSDKLQQYQEQYHNYDHDHDHDHGHNQEKSIMSELLIGRLKEENSHLQTILEEMKKTIHYCQHTHDTMQQSLTDKLSASDDLILHLRTMYYQQLQETKTLMATQRSLNTRLREMTLEQTCGLLSTPHRDKQPQHRKHQHPKPQEDMDQRRRALETLEQRQHKADRREYELQWNRVNDQVIQHFQHMHVSTMDHGHGEGVLPCTLDSNVEKDEKETLRMTVDWVQQQLDRETERCLRLVFQKRYYQRENRHLVHSEQKIAQLLHSLHWVTPVPIHRSPLFKWRACVSAIIAIHRLRSLVTGLL